MILLDYIVYLGLDAFKGYLTEKYDERQMKADIKSYVAKQQKLNINCAVEEELDFGGIVKYLCTDFHEDIEQRFTGETSKIRGQAHKHIVAMAASYAQAHTPEQKEHVKRMVNDALNILRSYYEKKLSREQKYLASRIAYDVIQSTASQHEEQTDRILQAIEKNAVSSPLCHAQARQLAQEGKLDILGDALTDLTETVSAKHILSPYYGFHPQTVCGKQQFVSVPLTKDAQKMYPPHFECSGRAYIDGHEIGSLSTDIIEYANNHQLSIHFVVESARKFLGTHTDPQQCEAQAIIGKEYLLPPKPFPEAMAYSIVIDDVIVARRDVRRQIVQQIAAERIGAGVAVESPGKRPQRVAAVAQTCDTRLGRRLVIGLSHIHGFGVSCAIPCLCRNNTQRNPRDDFTAQRHAREMHDADVIVGILVVFLTGGGAFRVAG